MPSPSFQVGQEVRITGGKFNGLEGPISWLGDVCCAVRVTFEGKENDCAPIDLIHVQDYKAWKDSLAPEERKLRGLK